MCPPSNSSFYSTCGPAPKETRTPPGSSELRYILVVTHQHLAPTAPSVFIPCALPIYAPDDLVQYVLSIPLSPQTKDISRRHGRISRTRRRPPAAPDHRRPRLRARPPVPVPHAGQRHCRLWPGVQRGEPSIVLPSSSPLSTSSSPIPPFFLFPLPPKKNKL